MGARLRQHSRGVAAEATCAVMAFEAQGEYDGTLQQLAVGRSVRVVTGFAAIHADGGVFVNEGSALVLVALDAGFFTAVGLVDHARADAGSPGGGEGPVRIVAI